MSCVFKDLFIDWIDICKAADVDSPRLSVEVLAAHVLKCSRIALHLNMSMDIEAAQAEAISELIRQRAAGVPVAYLTGAREFYGLDMKVSPAVLIPRPETEHIVELCEERFSPDQRFLFADFGTGSGALAVTLAHLFSDSCGVAVDISPEALQVCRENAIAHGVSKSIQCVRADFTQTVFQDESFELIVSNPPYVTDDEYTECSPEVREHEPRLALTSGADGLEHIKKLIPRVERALKPGGYFFMEFGWRQGKAIEKIVRQFSTLYRHFSIYKDLSGHDRVAVVQKCQ